MMNMRRSLGVSALLMAFFVSSLPAAFGFDGPSLLNSNATSDTGPDYWPSLATDGSGNWVVVWHSQEDLGGVAQGDADIFVSHSTDNGATWSDAALLNNNAADDADFGGGHLGYDLIAQVVTDDLGNWVVVWESEANLEGVADWDYDILFSRSLDAGATWASPEILNTTGTSDGMSSDRHPQMATDGLGNWIAVWDSDHDLSGEVGSDDDILLSRSTDAGATWASPEALNTNASSDSRVDSYPRVSTDSSGTWIAAWVSNEDLGGTVGTDYDVFFSRSTDVGATWASPEALNTSAHSDTGEDGSPRIATDGLGTWLAVWNSEEDFGGTLGTDEDILCARSTDGGLTWSAPALVNTTGISDTGDDYMSDLCMGGSGTWVVTWHSNEDIGGTTGSDFETFAARSIDGGLTWSEPQPVNVNAHGDSGYDGVTRLSTDGVGRWISVWQSNEDLGGTAGTDYDIFLAHTAEMDLFVSNGTGGGRFSSEESWLAEVVPFPHSQVVIAPGDTVTMDVSGEVSALFVSSGAALEEVNENRLSVYGPISNEGVLRYTHSGLTTGVHSFDLTLWTMNIHTLGTVSSIEIERIDSDSPNATGVNLLTGRYWNVSTDGSGYDISIDVGYDIGQIPDPYLARWNGSSWEIDRDVQGGANVFLFNVTEFSQWTLNNSSVIPVELSVFSVD